MRERRQRKFELYGGHPALDFANTVGWREGAVPEDHLETYDDLLAWATTAEVVEVRKVAALRRMARANQDESEAALQRARELREVSYRIFSALVSARRPKSVDIDRLNEVVANVSNTTELHWTQRGFEWRQPSPEPDLDFVLEPIARSVASLLTSNDATKLRQCQDDRGCGWLFLDRSRAQHRKWCSMADCGNRAKARRHYGRT